MKRGILWILLPLVIIVAVSIFYGCTEREEDVSGSIYGTVTDFQTNEPIGGVNVKIRPSGEATLTGSDGSFIFQDLKPGQYSLSFSKQGYNDLDDDYIIVLESGKAIKRDVQMSKNVASLHITDMQGNSINELDFGIEESINTKSFNIFNNGSSNITCEVTYSCFWITSVSSITNPITPGQTVTVTVAIDRSRLASGDNNTILHIVSNNGSNELTIKATGIDLPTVNTSNVTNITASSGSCGGNVIADGGSYVTERGICWSTSNEPTIEGSHQSMGQGNGIFSCNMSNLESNNIYYVRAYATNNRGTAYGEQRQFTTKSGLPVVTINNVSNVTATSATCGGNVTDNGGYAITSKGLVWSTAQYPTLNDNHISLGSGNSSFTGTMTSLTISTTYYVRAYATNSKGTSYSEQRQFTTNNGLPTVTINNISNITATSATCGGSISNNGGFPITDKGLVWSTSQYPTLSNNHVSLGSGNNPFSGTMTSLTISTTYYVRAYATNSTGTNYSAQQSFTTGNGLPTVVTTVPTRNELTVTSGGNVTNDGGYPVIARGICYSTTPYPDLSSSHSHTTNGSGTGTFSSTFTIPSQGVYYVRAYATNSVGTSYGEQMTVNHPYNDLPTFTYGGQTYRVAPPATTTMNWSTANSYCNNLTLYGYSDWRLPTGAELSAAIMNNLSDNSFNSWLWSSTQCNFEIPGVHYEVHYHGAGNYSTLSCEDNSTFHYVRPIRVEN